MQPPTISAALSSADRRFGSAPVDPPLVEAAPSRGMEWREAAKGAAVIMGAEGSASGRRIDRLERAGKVGAVRTPGRRPGRQDGGRRDRELRGVAILPDPPAETDPTRLARSPAVAAALERVLCGIPPAREDANLLMACPDGDVAALCAAARVLRQRGKGRTVSFSPKVFIPLTRLCRDTCGYCTFRTDPSSDPRLYMTPEEVLAVARAGERLGCTEALFTLGERPEQRFPEARRWLARRGHRSTLSYLREAAALVLRETSLWPHLNPGTMSRAEMASLRDVSASMGLMLESVSERLCGPRGPHEHAPSKHPRARLRTLEVAGMLRVPFTTGLLVGIGETPLERVETLLAIRESHARWGQIQEVIIQNFRAKPHTPMASAPEPGVEDVMRTAAVARLILGRRANIQVPPNLTARAFPAYLDAGINDWGGVSPLTIDYVNPEAPWPQISLLRASTEAAGLDLRPRLAVYPEYILHHPGYIASSLRNRLSMAADSEGFAKGGLARHGVASA